MKTSLLQCRPRLASVAGWALGLLLAMPAGAAEPDFRELYDLVRSNVTGLSEADLNQAAIRGLARELPGLIVLETNRAGEASAPLARTNLFDEAFGYVRVARVDEKLAEQLEQAVAGMTTNEPLKGLVLDLRFAAGEDYTAAARAADRFLSEEKVLLTTEGKVERSTTKTNAFAQPVAILCNRETRSAAEALAGILRQSGVGLLIGANTAGQASQFRDFTLRDGRVVRLAAEPVKLADGATVPHTGLAPDIEVVVPPADELKYLEDAYRDLSNPAGSRTNAASAGFTRVNEAELVRQKREGVPATNRVPRMAPPRSTVPEEPPVVRDPSLARALDLLKGLAVVQSSHKQAK